MGVWLMVVFKIASLQSFLLKCFNPPNAFLQAVLLTLSFKITKSLPISVKGRSTHLISVVQRSKNLLALLPMNWMIWPMIVHQPCSVISTFMGSIHLAFLPAFVGTGKTALTALHNRHHYQITSIAVWPWVNHHHHCCIFLQQLF